MYRDSKDKLITAALRQFEMGSMVVVHESARVVLEVFAAQSQTRRALLADTPQRAYTLLMTVGEDERLRAFAVASFDDVDELVEDLVDAQKRRPASIALLMPPDEGNALEAKLRKRGLRSQPPN